ncbi:MAG: hypothetical protein GY699_12825 [Desulfobacteraceae bacterium]|nr:hypothetical protein [Desulfobacteraceae bacterium]
MKKLLAGIVGGFLLFCIAGFSQAALTTIGTAQFGGVGQEYNLIWDDDNNGNSVVWLDYTKYDDGLSDAWSKQTSWAASLEGTLSYNIDDAYTVDWGTNSWRLPNAGAILGYSATDSEMGHLFYNELGLKSYTDNGNKKTTFTDLNATNFNRLEARTYYTGTEYPDNPDSVFFFGMDYGGQSYVHKNTVMYFGYGLAIRTGEVSTVPIPGAIWLLGTGLLGLVGLKRKNK